MSRHAEPVADGWYPLGSNPTFPMGTPEQLKAGLARVAAYARRFNRDPAEIEVIYRTHQFQLQRNGGGPSGERTLFVGAAGEIASDIRQYEQIGVGSLVFDFVRQTQDMSEVLERMEEFATEVWPQV